MASLFKRLRNVFDDHQDGEKQTVITQTAERFRDDLLGQALQVKNAWTNDLIVDHHNAFISANYRGRLEEINLALGSVQQLAPSVSAHLDIDDFQKSAAEKAREALAGSIEHLEELDAFQVEEDGPDNRAWAVAGGHLLRAEPHAGTYVGRLIAVGDGEALQQVSPGVAVAHQTKLLDREVSPGEWARINYSALRGSVKLYYPRETERELAR